ncbi:hypothetical protein HQ496_11090 [bacterium]|nr:hypothetical protein [bacterium]
MNDSITSNRPWKSFTFGFAIFGLLILAAVFLLPVDQISKTNEGRPVAQAEESGLEARMKRQIARTDFFNMIYGDPVTHIIPEGIVSREIAYAKSLPKIDEYASKNSALGITWAESGNRQIQVQIGH